ncbi:DUF1638 domain-containing protein [Methylogaea oryzae]|uniref:DUF1638 domain-containing protein n=1 Tax=Methylogaea oryzae TaxID=1295382 RepID=A0A8D5AHW0_9GAMM|nr:DUF1638 domain-containing protein [Methylogaea oryzae]BBL70691.1 hypothetical protein MoryE10_12970 [Methylogaea oryzae]
MADSGRLSLVGCGVLRKEIARLIEQNHWLLDTDFLEASLHVNLKRLSDQLGACLERHRDERPIVFYGCCHPRMDAMLESVGAFRTDGQNCVEMLLGRERFMAELEAGAYFLLEDWAIHWESVVADTFGGNWAVARDIFHESRRYLLAIRTPCSGDFSAAAERAAQSIDLPLRWMDVGLESLQAVLAAAMARKQAACR